MRFACLVITLFAATLSTGCASYINIPSQRGDVANHSPNNGTFRQTAAIALRRILVKHPPAGHYVVELPAGTTEYTSAWIMKRLPQPEGEAPADAELPTYAVKQARIRNNRAQIDIVHNTTDGVRLSSVFLEWDWHGWFVTRDRLWRVKVDDALMLARPMPVENSKTEQLPPVGPKKKK